MPLLVKKIMLNKIIVNNESGLGYTAELLLVLVRLDRYSGK